jgi:hypothetical protein
VALDASMQLPLGVVGRADVRRMQHELEELENFLQQAKIRHPGTKVNMPRATRMLEEVVTLNKFNLLQPVDRQKAMIFLQGLLDHAPTAHVSFSSDPSASFTAKIVQWFRAEIDPHTLVDVGLQPNIAAGCIVRTANRVFDFSLREHFNQQRGLLTAALASVGPVAPASQSDPSGDAA